MFPNQFSNQVIVVGLTHEKHTSLSPISMIKDPENCVQKPFTAPQKKMKETTQT